MRALPLRIDAMARGSTGSLFDVPDEGPTPTGSDGLAPLAERMRPADLSEFVGQAHLVGEKAPLRVLLAGGRPLPSLILWGGPGTGKTSLARLLARQAGAEFVPLSAVFAGVREARAAIEEARKARRRGRRTVLFIDEIHRFNMAQQDALLPAVEDGTIILIGATTENPSFEVNGALLSRTRVVSLHPLTEAEVSAVIRRALDDAPRGLSGLNPEVSTGLILKLAKAASGDARVALSALEAAVHATELGEDGVRRVTEPTLVEALGRARFACDKGGEDHYNLASAVVPH